MWHHTTVLVCLTQTVTCFDWLICSSAVGLADCLSVSEQLWQYCCSSFPPIEADAEITHMHWHTGSVGSWMFLLSSHRALPGRCFPWRRDGKAESEWTGSLYTCVCVCVCSAGPAASRHLRPPARRVVYLRVSRLWLPVDTCLSLTTETRGGSWFKKASLHQVKAS